MSRHAGQLDGYQRHVRSMMNLIICILGAVCLLSSGSLSQPESPPDVSGATSTTTTLSWVPSPHVAPHNESHGVSDDDYKGTDDAAAGDEDNRKSDDDSPAAGDASYDGRYPDPREDPRDCHVGDNPAWLCNKDDVLDVGKAKNLNKLLESLVEASGICPCQDLPCSHNGLPMTVVVLHTISENQNKSHQDREEHVHNLAQDLLSNWRSSRCDNGAVTVVVADDKIVVTVIGQASKSLVPDDCREFVENATSSFFEEGRVDEGLTVLIEQYRSIVLTRHSCNSDAHLKRSIIIPIILVLALIIVAAIVAVVLLIYRRRGSQDIRTEANVPLKDQQQQQQEPEKA